MTHEAIDTEFEDLLRTTLHEMVPKLAASTPVVEEADGHGAAVVRLSSRRDQTSGPRRTAAAVLAVAAVILGLIVIATRNTDEVTPGDSVSGTAGGVPAWYDMIKPSLPDRFPFAALTFATDAQLFFVAVNPTDGKTLEIQLASNAYSTEPTTTVDATGAWVESAQGWSVKTPSGLFVSVTCNIGVGGRDYVGATNYCDMASAGGFTKADIHAVANSLATSLTLSIFDTGLRVASVDPIDIDAAEGLARSAFPGVQFGARGFGESDEIISSEMDDANPTGTAPALTNVVKADTSIRLLSGLYPTPTVSDPVSTALYEDAAVIWQFGPGGVLVRISTTDPSPQSDALLQQLAQDIVALIPTTPDANPAVTITPPATTTTMVFDDGSNPAVVGVVVVDASDRSLGSDFAQYLQANGVQVLSVIPATISSPETMLQPLEADSHSAHQLDLLLQVGGFDTFTPTEIDGELPKGATVVVVLGADGGPPTYRGSVNTTNTAIPTSTTIVGPQDVAVVNESATTTTPSFCDGPGALPIAVVANASRVNDTATWWTDQLGVNVVDVHFADPVNAVARADHSRVVALSSSDCEATQIAKYTTGTSVDFVTADELQALVLGPLPSGTSIVVLIGNDNLSQLATGVTTTSNGF